MDKLHCSLCNKVITKHSYRLQCANCKCSYHLNCLNCTREEYQVLKIEADWYCLWCNESILPFNHIEHDVTFRQSLLEFYCTVHTNVLKDLSNLAFIPFEFNDEHSSTPLFDINPDYHFFNEYNSCITGNCNYYLEDSFNDFMDTHVDFRDSFSLMHHNINRLNKNNINLSSYLDNINHKFTIIAITETWLNESNADLFNFPYYQHICHYRDNRAGGGVSLFVKDTCSFIERKDMIIDTESKVCESLFIEIDGKSVGSNKNIIVGVIYRPPDRSIKKIH